MLNIVLLITILSIVVQIDTSGIVYVDMVVKVDEGMNIVPLPIPPVVETIDVIIDNTSIVPIYENRTLYILAPHSGYVRISYVANVSIANNVFILNITTNNTVTLIIPPNIVLLTVPQNIVSIEMNNSNLVLKIVGPQTIEYIVKKITTTTTTRTTTTTKHTNITTTSSPSPTTTATITTTTATTTTRTTTTTATTIPTPKTYTTVNTTTTTRPTYVYTTTTQRTTAAVVVPTISTPTTTTVTTTTSTTTMVTTTVQSTTITTTRTMVAPLPIPYYILLIILALLLGLPIGYIYKKRRVEPFLESLDDIDKKIIEILRERGGSMYQSELQKLLNIPRSTLWRHVRKLERLGILEIVKERGFNKLILKR